MKRLTHEQVTRKALEKVAISAYARHLLHGLSDGSYSVDEARRYLSYAMEDAGGHCPDYVKTDDNVFGLYDNYKYNVDSLRERMTC